jgi:hypothetical protein
MAFRSTEGLTIITITGIITAILFPIVKNIESNWLKWIAYTIFSIVYLYGSWVATIEDKQFNGINSFFTPIFFFGIWICLTINIIIR